MIKIKPAQSILEYAILIAIVIAAVVVMQVYMKRGISGRLKESSDKISGGESFSASNTTTWERSNMTTSRDITELTATTDNAVALGTLLGQTVNATGDKAYSAGKSEGGATTSNAMSRTDSAANEAFKAGDLVSDTTGTAGDYQPGTGKLQ